MTDEQIAESYRQQILKIGDEVCSTMITDYYNEFKNQTLYPKEIEFINDKIDGISGYIATIEQQRKNKVNRQNNGLTDGIKLTPDFLNLTGYKNFLEWLYDRKKQIEGEKNNSIMNTIFDLTAYPLTAAGTHPYLYIKKETDFFYVYDGKIGQNKFAYFKINASSEAGEKCDSFYDKYVTKNEHRFSYIEDIQALKSFIEDKAAEKLTGLEAYLKYYFEALPIEDKLRNGFYAIQHFEALKDWFNLVLENHNKKNEIHYSTKEIKEAEIRKFTTDILKKVSDYLLPPHSINTAVISRATATEFIKFYEWLNESLNPKEVGNSKPAKSFKSIFSPQYNGYDVCLELMEYLGVTDSEGIVIMSDFKIYPLVAIIMAFKESRYLINENLPEKTILEYFNLHLNKEYKTLKKTAKEYKETLIDAGNFITNNIKKI